MTNERALNDMQERVEEAQLLSQRVRSTRQRLMMDSLGYVILHHGTSMEAADSIRGQGRLERSSYFAASESGCRPHVYPKHGKSAVYASFKVDPRDIEFSTGTGEFYAPLGLCRTEHGVWVSPVRAALMTLLQDCPELVATDGRCHDLALGLLQEIGEGGLCALLRADEENESLLWYSHMVYVDATDACWDATGSRADERWMEQWDEEVEWEFVSLDPDALPAFLEQHGQRLRPASLKPTSTPSCPSL